MKLGDLVTFAARYPSTVSKLRRMGVVVAFDEDKDPLVLWFSSHFGGIPEVNFRRHLSVLSSVE